MDACCCCYFNMQSFLVVAFVAVQNVLGYTSELKKSSRPPAPPPVAKCWFSCELTWMPPPASPPVAPLPVEPPPMFCVWSSFHRECFFAALGLVPTLLLCFFRCFARWSVRTLLCPLLRRFPLVCLICCPFVVAFFLVVLAALLASGFTTFYILTQSYTTLLSYTTLKFLYLQLYLS